MLGQFRDRLVRCIRLRVADALPPLAIPFPNEFRIARERFRRCQLCRIEVSPVTVLAAKCGDTALSRNAGACNYKDASGGRPYQPIWRPLFCSSSQLISGLK
jgi:hypothetical protein